MNNSISRIGMILIPFFLFACNGKEEKDSALINPIKQEISNNPTLVKAIELIPMEFTHDLVSNGTIGAARKVDLRFHNSEVIRTIYVKNGERAVKGQKLAELDTSRLKNSLDQAKDNLERTSLEFQDILIGQGYVLKDSLTIPEEVMTIAKIRSNYTQNLINYKMAERELLNSTLYAPFSGIVANLFSKEYNQSIPSETFCSIIDNTTLEVTFNILESELNVVRQKDKVTIYPYAINNLSVDGHIIEVNPAVDKNGMVRVKASLANPTQLYDGMNVKVLIRRKADSQLVIPKEALVLRNNREVVFTLKNGKAVWNYVEAGAENSYGYIINGSLQEGDSVIYDGNINLSHDAPVVLVK